MAPTATRSRHSATRHQYVIEQSSEDELQAGRVTPTPSDLDQQDDEEPTPVPKRAAPRRSTRSSATSSTASAATTAKKPVRRGRKPKTQSSETSHIDETTTMDVEMEDVADAPARPARRGRKPKNSRAETPQLKDMTAMEDVEMQDATMDADQTTPPAEQIPPKPHRRRMTGRSSTATVNRHHEASVLPTPEPSASPEPAQIPKPEPESRQNPAPVEADAGDHDDTVTATEHTQIEMINPKSTILENPIDIMIKSRNVAAPAPADEPAAPGPRMVITHLALINFKSYAGRQMVGPFHASFSSVVGPNGSGKSNVIDALLFVFGFRASKMRQGKISALIHNSVEHPDLPFAEVEVYFQQVVDQPDGSHAVVPDSQLIVSRRVFRNSSSKYYMNKQETNFTAMTEFLRVRGIDLDHKRFLILQGEVESIAQMKPKAANENDDGLLEYLEDIIGTAKYKTPIDEAAAEVETLNDVCAEKNNRVQHVEKEKDGLEDKKDRALAFLHDENELTEKRSVLYQIYIDECNDNTRVTEEAMLQMQQLLDHELEKHQGNEDGIRELQREYKKGAREYDAMEQATQQVLREMAKYDKDSVRFEEKQKFLLGKKKKLDKTMHTSRLSASECMSQVEKHTDDIQRKTGEIAAFEAELQVQERELAAIRESLRGKTQGLSDQIAEKQRSLEPWNARITEKQAAVAVAQSELDILNEKRNAGAVATREAEAKIAAVEQALEEKRAELEERRAARAELEAEAERIRCDLQRVAAKEPEIRARISHARQKADEARASLTSSQNQSSVLRGLVRLRESGRVDGFHGRLGHLATIDEKFDVAISTACPGLESLVVDSVDVGQACIDYLRKNSLGRANFIVLDRLPRRDMAKLATPENVPRLFDLIRPVDARFAPAFYSVMQNTLVAGDLEQANRIAYGGARRWRVVTLDGQLIDTSGTMSGGGTRVARGGMSSKPVADVTAEQASRLEDDRDELERKFAVFQNKQRQLEQLLKSKNYEIPAAETAIQKIQLEMDSYARHLADSRRRVQEIAAEHRPSKTDDAQAAALEDHIGALRREADRLRAETGGVEHEIQALQDHIMEIGGVKLRSQKARVDGLREQMALLADEISNAEVAKSRNEGLRAKHERTRADAAHEMEAVDVELERVRADVDRQAGDVSVTRRQTEEVQEALDAKREQLVALKEELDAKVSELNESRASEIEMRNKLEENQKILAENQRRGKYWEDKLAKLSLHRTDLGSEEQREAGGDQGDQGEEQDASQHPPALPIYTKDELADMNKDALKAAIVALEEKSQNAMVDLSALDDYRRRAAEYTSRTADLTSALAARDTAKARLDEMRQQRLTGFMQGFSAISLKLKEMYQMITMGGNAELELVDSLDPFSEGILFSVMPPKKSWKNIANLSGGEKTLSSLALVFALHHYKPTPLYVMDEIDAALDFRNVSIVAAYIKERTRNAQFIVISLRNNMFELAARLVGVYKVNHMTKSVTIENRDYIRRG